jgi:hypothetical protein
MRTRALLFGLGFLILSASESWSIPAFARRYNLSCTTCHAPFPKLKPYGADFAANGFIMKENEKERDYVSAGDEDLWLNKTFPLAVRFDAYALKDDSNPKTDMQSPWGLKLLSGGTVYKKIGYYFYFFMSERGEVAGIEDAYIHFDNVFNTSLDIMVGQFQTSDPLMKRELRLTFEDYMLYKYKPGLSQTDLTYDRGIMLMYGIDRTGTDIVATFTNGNGKGMANEETKKFDNNNAKNIGLRVMQGIGDHITIGGYYYTGKETLAENNLENSVSYIGPDINLAFGPLEVTAEYLQRTDDNAQFLQRGAEEAKTKATILEAVFAPQLDRSKVYFTALYNDIKNEDTVYQTFTMGGTYLLARNLRTTLEYTRDLLHDKNRFVLGLVTGF